MVSNKKTVNWKANVFAFINKVFNFIETALHVVFSIIENLMRTLTVFFGLLIKTVTNGNFTVVVSIILFIIVAIITAVQWFQFGMWAASLFGIQSSSFSGLGMGTVGMLGGLGVNYFQLQSEFYKISQDWARAYLKLNIDVNKDVNEEETTVKERVNHWYSFAHASLKSSREFSYLAEIFLTAVYLVASGRLLAGDFIAFGQAIISLALPEKVTKYVSFQVGMMAKVNEVIREAEIEEAEKQKPNI